MQDIKACCCHQLGVAAALMAAGGKSWCSPCDGPRWVSERGGASRRLSLVGQRDQHQSRARRPPIPTISTCSPCLCVPPSHCLSFPDFPAYSRFQLRFFPGKPGCWQTGRLSAGLALTRVWMGIRAKAGPGAGRSSLLVAAAHPRGSRVPRTPPVPWLKPVALNPLRLLCLKGREGLL